MTMSQELFEAARGRHGKAHAPYSKFPVGAAMRAEDGKHLCRRQCRERRLSRGLVRGDHRDRP